ncbi:hypothetical protein AAG570_010930 [Ranatra chinensis]|uniref:Cadherin domain-containing protein n=1 Tax=Ranatra chinensis TaxID=642074 RepID=A0ABD0YJA3_9HEMI
MSRFSLPEDTRVGAPVYRLQGADPENSSVHYSISGQHFIVDKQSGIVSLVRPLDRETLDLLEVIISITDESVGGTEPNTVSLRREIPVVDVNDNQPQFVGRPYSVVVLENAKVGSIVYSNITVTDADSGYNAEIILECIHDGCDSFLVETEKISEGHYMGILKLASPLDFETKASYSLTLRASDSSPKKSLSAMATIAISVMDVQDQPPIFLNAPYSATLQENTPPGLKVLEVKARDGDMGDPRSLLLMLEGDDLNYFTLANNSIVTSLIPIDREHPLVLHNGGVYTFKIKATELINNELPGDFSTERVTIVITDVDDQIPQFNLPVFHINVSEDIGIGTPLPGLNMVVFDSDLGSNSRYSLYLNSADRRVKEWFIVEPSEASGRTPVVIRVKSNAGFDYDSGLRHIQFTVGAFIHTTQGEAIEASKADVIVTILDANDNSPMFSQASYSYTIPENLNPGAHIANITAVDIDSNEYGQITYSLRGFGMDKFGTNPQDGNLYLKNKVDYEKQKSYSLSLEAKDGGGRITTVPLLVSLTDINDNAPVWESAQYQRTVREGATVFQPQFFVRALDADKDGESKLEYKMLMANSDVLIIDEETGEIKITSPVSSSHTSRGQYEFIVRVFDDGNPPLHSDTPVFVRVGVPGNQRPVFRNVPYNATIPETASGGDSVITVRATDPDGLDSSVQYKIAIGADNFKINASSGEISVSGAAILDPDVTSISRYFVTVLAVDSGTPIRETAQTTVTVNIQDINNKPPYFPPNANYVRHISERTDIGKTVVSVQALDPDSNSDLEYKLMDVKAIDKTGVPVVHTHTYDYKNAFRINKTTGEIQVHSPLNHEAAATVILTVEATDKNAAIDKEHQTATVEVTLYIQAYDEQNPKFLIGAWTVTDPYIRFSIQEETPVGNTILKLSAIDPPTNLPIMKFSIIPPVPVAVSMDSSGHVVLRKHIDYEAMEEKVISFRVLATSNDDLRTSEAEIILNIEDINDHPPEFKNNIYKGTVQESAHKDSYVLKVEATDSDKSNTTKGYGDIVYSLSGENAALFSINSSTGEIRVSGNGSIDREKIPMLRFLAIASDTPQGGVNQKKTSVPVLIEVEDVNDNAPMFNAAEYSAVVLENVAQGTSVVNLTATDLDTGLGGIIEYEFIQQIEANGLFSINKDTGEVKTKKPLTGKGRTEPYILSVRAQDGGEPSLFTDIALRIYVGDVVSNDGIPTFIHPTVDEMAYISENSSIGSPVFRVIASDPDDPNTLEGLIHFSFLQDGADSLAFNIDSITGLITTMVELDREEKENYTVIIVAQDSGAVPQHSTRQLHISVTDIDDHKPVFKRSINQDPIEFNILEELENGSNVGIVEAIDLDSGENSNIGYLITSGNEDGLFSLTRLPNNTALITTASRIDRETAAEHLLTVKCFKLSTQPHNLRKEYNKQDFSEVQIRIIVLDIDDNLPRFVENNITVGVRLNVPIDTLLTVLTAIDVDAEAPLVTYAIENITFIPPRTFSRVMYHSMNSSLKSLFNLDNNTGELRTAGSVADYYDGYFKLKVSASNNNSDESVFAIVKVFIVRDRALMKFIFSQPPGEVRANLPSFKKELETAIGLPVTLNIYDTLFNAKLDGSLDFSSTSSCFQLVGTHSFDLKEMESLLILPTNTKINEVYKKYNVQQVEKCVPVLERAEVTWVQLCVLSIACFIGIASAISGCILCCTYNR